MHIYVTDPHTGRFRPWFDDDRTLSEADALMVLGIINHHFPGHKACIRAAYSRAAAAAR